MLIDRMIENKREALYRSIDNNGMTHKETLKISNELNKLIIKRM